MIKEFRFTSNTTLNATMPEDPKEFLNKFMKKGAAAGGAKGAGIGALGTVLWRPLNAPIHRKKATAACANAISILSVRQDRRDRDRSFDDV